MIGSRRVGVADALCAAGGWIVLGAVALAAWPDGGLRPAGIAAVEQLVGLGVLLWAVGRALRPAPPGVPLPCLAPALALFLFGWWMALHPRSAYDWRAHRLVPVGHSLGTIDLATSIESMTRVSALLGALCVLCDLARRSQWRLRTLGVLAANGTAIVIWGIILRLTSTAPAAGDAQARFGFSTFEYHGNAGAFINLAIPALAGLLFARGSAGRRGGAAVAVALGAALLVCIAGALANTSRAAQFVTALILIALAAYAWRTRRAGYRVRVRPAHAAAVVAVAGVVGLALAAGGITAWQRWSNVTEAIGLHGARATLWRICGHLIGHARPFGYGPGTFKVLMPMAPDIATLYSQWIVTWHVPGGPVSLWSNAHQDYLQTIIEWGWAGAAVWAFLVFGGIARAVRMLARPDPSFPQRDRAITFCALVAVAGTCLHAAVDFPLQVLSIQAAFVACLAVCWAAGAHD